jgi:hypothetical protein
MIGDDEAAVLERAFVDIYNSLTFERFVAVLSCRLVGVVAFGYVIH